MELETTASFTHKPSIQYDAKQHPSGCDPFPYITPTIPIMSQLFRSALKNLTNVFNNSSEQSSKAEESKSKARHKFLTPQRSVGLQSLPSEGSVDPLGQYHDKEPFGKADARVRVEPLSSHLDSTVVVGNDLSANVSAHGASSIQMRCPAEGAADPLTVCEALCAGYEDKEPFGKADARVRVEPLSSHPDSGIPHGVTTVPGIPPQRRRKPEDIRNVYALKVQKGQINSLDFPEDCPKGYWKTEEQAIQALQLWAKDPALGGGSFSLCKSSRRNAIDSRGLVLELSCNRRGGGGSNQTQKFRPSLKCHCPFKIVIEDSSEGFMLQRGTFSHNHDLPTSRNGGLCITAGLKEIPEEYLELARRLNTGRFTAARIDKALKFNAKEDGIPITWSYDTIYNMFRPTVHDRCLDASGMVDYLNKRGLPYNIDLDEDGCIQNTFFVMHNAYETWSWNQSISTPVLFDTSHGTNKYAQKLGCFATTLLSRAL